MCVKAFDKKWMDEYGEKMSGEGMGGLVNTYR